MGVDYSHKGEKEMKRFSKAKFLEAVRKVGNMGQITPEMECVLDNFDGCEATKNSWKALVFGTEEYIVTGKGGRKDSFPLEGIIEV